MGFSLVLVLLTLMASRKDKGKGKAPVEDNELLKWKAKWKELQLVDEEFKDDELFQSASKPAKMKAKKSEKLPFTMPPEVWLFFCF